MLKCSGCQQNKPETEFHKSSRNKTGYQSYCKDCNRKAVVKHIHAHEGQNYAVRKARHQDLRQRSYDYKRERGCACCPEKEPQCLDFHHLDPSTKEGLVSNMVKISWDRFLEEAKKCVLLCANCHRKVHLGLIELPPHSSA